MNGPSSEPRPVAILCAMPEERQLLVDNLTDAHTASRSPYRADRGVLDDVDVVIAEAGVGKANAASTATALMERHGCRALVLSGIAGGVRDDLDVGDVVVARRVIDTDYGRVTDAGHVAYQPGALPFPGVEPDVGYELTPELATAIEERLAATDPAPGPSGPRVVLGTVATGDVFVASPRYRDELGQRWQVDAVEMEGAAICGVATRYRVPWLIVRALSDRAGEDSIVDLTTFVDLASTRSAGVVRRLLPLLDPMARER